MNDTSLFSLSKDEFKALVQEALRSNRGGLLSLSESRLAQSSLVEDCLLEGEGISDRGRGRVMRAVLAWAVDEALRPDGEHDWLALEWRLYNVVFYAYFEGLTFERLAETIDISTTAVYQWRSKAITRLAKFLHKELRTAQHLRMRHKYTIMARYEALSVEQKEVARFMALFRHAIPQRWLDELAQEAQLPKIGNNINDLLTSNLLRRGDDLAQLALHPQVRAPLQSLLSADERQEWHHRAAKKYHAQEDYLEASYHYRQTGTPKGYKCAAETIITHKQAILDQLQASTLRNFLAQFKRHELSHALHLWYQLKIISGDLAGDAKDIESALKEYAKALRAQDIEIKAEAYYRRAKAYVRQDIDEALLHYDYCIELLQNKPQYAALLVQAYIDRAWIFVQERPDTTQAKQNLQQAQESTIHDPIILITLHNAWAGFYSVKRNAPDQVIHHSFQAWRAANEAQDVVWMIKTGRNLGDNYAELLQEYEKALKYLHQAKELAHKAAQHEQEILCIKSIGACHFWQAKYQEAIRYYKMAHDLSIEMGNSNLQASMCYDLAEAYAEMQAWASMRQYLYAGIKLSQQLGQERYLAGFQALIKHYFEINDAQFKAICFVVESGQIKNQQYRKINNMQENERRKTSRHLKALCEKGLLKREGNSYRLASW